MRRTITHVYLVVLDGDDLHVEVAGPLGWYFAIRDLSQRCGWTVALDQHGRRIGQAQCPVPGSDPAVIVARDGTVLDGEERASAMLATVERCSTARRVVGGDLVAPQVTRWRAGRIERGENVPPWPW